MRNRFIPSVLLATMATIIGCSGLRTRMIIEETRETMKQAEKYDVASYAPDQFAKAQGNIRSSERMLQKNRKTEARHASEKALFEASEALRISRQSKTAISLKQARDALKLVEKNRAQDINPAIHTRLKGDVRKATRAFISERWDACINSSRNARFHADILLEPLKKEVDARNKKIQKQIENLKDPPAGIQSLRQELREAVDEKNHRRALDILEKMESRIRAKRKNP